MLLFSYFKNNHGYYFGGSQFLLGLLPVLTLLILSGCGNYTAVRGVPIKQVSPEQYKSFTYSESHPVEGTPSYKIGNPYKIKGTSYYPKVDYEYNEVGIASWYGAEFHNKKTANGEIYNQNSLTAAHRTLPLPSIVIVTNLENGHSLKLRINDRGPFAKGRIIDVSKRAAEILGFSEQGTAPVKVQIVATESRKLAELLDGKSEIIARNNTLTQLSGQKLVLPTRSETKFQTLPPPTEQSVAGKEQDDFLLAQRGPETKRKPVAKVSETKLSANIDFSQRIFIQVGAFSEEENLKRALLTLAEFGYPVSMQDVGKDSLRRVLLGPLDTLDKDTIEELIDKANQQGFPEAYIFVMQ